MSKTHAGEPVSEPAAKKQRLGVGTSVATVDHKPTDEFILCLSQIKVERLQPKNRTLHQCERSEVLPVVFKKLVDNNVLSLPVLNQKGKYYGMVEVMDIVRFTIDMFSDITNTSMIDLERIFESDQKFSTTAAADVMRWPLTKNNPFHPLAKGYSLFSAWEVLALSGASRIPVVDDAGKVVDLVTQSMLIDFLWQNIEKVGDLAQTKVHDFKVARKAEVHPVARSTKAIIGFREMVSRGVDHLAVVDETGKLVDNLSLRDLRGIRPDAKVFYRFWSSIGEYKETVRKEFPEKTPGSVLHLLSSSTLYEIVEIMAIKHVHHVYIVDSNDSMVPKQVISQADVLREVLGR